MPRVPLLFLLIAAARAADVFVIADTANQTHALAEAFNDTVLLAAEPDFGDSNDTLTDGEHDPVVRKKRTFGDIVFRGLADVLGYNVARKPPQAFQFPPPLAPVPGIDSPAQAGPAPAPAAPPAPPAPPAAPAPPCAAPRAAAPPPCRARPAPAQPKALPPCAKPRAAPPRPKPTRAPAPPPCGAPKANPATPAPCTPSPPPKADSNLETINTNFRLNFNFNRAPATPTPVGEAEEAEEDAPLEQSPVNPIAIQPRAAKLPPPAPRNPRVYVDAFVLRDGVAQRVHTIDAQNINRAPAADDDYLFYVDDEPASQQDNQGVDDDYDDDRDAQDIGDRSSALREVGTAVDQFWMQKQKSKKKLPAKDYRQVHFGDRDIANQLISRSDEPLPKSKRPRSKPKSVSKSINSDIEEDSEITTTTQDPRRKLKPRVLPPTEHNPNQIDTVTVRVPPIYKEKRPKKLHSVPEKPDRDENDYEEPPREYEEDTDSEQSIQVDQTERPKRKRRRKKARRVRSTYGEAYSAGDYDYYGKKLPISQEEEHFKTLTVPPPTRDADVARLEDAEDDGHFLDDHERLREDSERIVENKSKSNKDDEKERADDSERSEEDERSDDESERAGESEKTDKLSPNARVRETGYNNKYVRAHNVRVDRPRPHRAQSSSALQPT